MVKKYIPLSVRRKLGGAFDSAKRILSFEPPNEITPPEERRLFELLKDRMHVVFDVGARDEISFYAMKPDCEYHLFEPNKKFVKSLTKQVTAYKDHKIIINDFGLSDVTADDCVYYEKSQSFIVNPTFEVGDVDTGVRYSLRRLDDYVKEKGLQTIDYLKIDAEGLDYKIIKGGLTAIKQKTSFIQFEWWDGVKKFADLLGKDFRLYMMVEPTLRKLTLQNVVPVMSEGQKSLNFQQSLIELSEEVIDLIDNKYIATFGYGGNILGVSKERVDREVDAALTKIT